MRAFSRSGILGGIAMAVLLLCSQSGAALAAAKFISAPNRVDIAYDDARGLLYISSGTQVLRYQLSTSSFLSPITLGGSLMGMDISPDGSTLAVADASYDATNNWIHLVNLDTLNDNVVKFALSFSEAGTWAVAYGNDGALLVTTGFQGSGWVPLRRYDPTRGKTTIVADSIDQDTMVRTSANGKIIALAEPNNSGGPYDRFTVKGKTFTAGGGTGWYNFEIGVAPNGSSYAIPTYGGTFIADQDLHLTGTVIGQYAGPQPIAAAYDPKKALVYFPWAETSQVKVYSTGTWQEVGSFDFVDTFSHTGNWAFTNGRAKTSKDGTLLFVTVDGGVRYVKTHHGKF